MCLVDLQQGKTEANQASISWNGLILQANQIISIGLKSYLLMVAKTRRSCVELAGDAGFMVAAREGWVRVSLHRSNTPEEVDRFLEIV